MTATFKCSFFSQCQTNSSLISSLQEECECRGGDTQAFTAYAKPNELEALVHWSVPEVKCSDYGEGQMEPPGIKSPANFSLGKHVITYSYTYKRDNNTAEFRCYINFTVVGK